MRKLLCVLVVLGAIAAPAADDSLFFREDWTDGPPSLPLTQRDVANAALEVSLHGPGKGMIKKSYHNLIPNDPHYIWSGLTPASWAVSLRRKDGAAVDLTQGRIRWRARQSGFHELRVIVKTAAGDWFVSDASDDASDEWRVREVDLEGIAWRTLNIEKVVEGKWAETPDLSQVVEVGFTDLQGGGGSPASSRLDWIEVHGRPIR